MVRLWDLSTHEAIEVFLCEFVANSVSFSADGRVLGAAGNGLKFWDVASRREIELISGDIQSIKQAAFAPGAGLLVTGSKDGTISVWDINDGRRTISFEVSGEPKALGVSTDGSLVAVGYGGTIALFDVTKEELSHQFQAHMSGISQIAFTQDSSTLASAGWDGTVKLWNVVTAKIALTFRHVGPVTGLSFSADGNLMVTSGADGTVRLRHAASLSEADSDRR